MIIGTVAISFNLKLTNASKRKIVMNEVLDFLRSALPWIAIGLFLACSCVTMHAKKESKENECKL